MKRAFQLAFLLLLPLLASGSEECALTEDSCVHDLPASVAEWFHLFPSLLNPSPLRLCGEQASAPDIVPCRPPLIAPPIVEPGGELDLPFADVAPGERLIEEIGPRNWIGIQLTAAKSI